VQRTENLEYRLASAIRTLTRSRKPVLGLLESAPGIRLSALEEQLREGYDVRRFSAADSTQPAADVAALLVVGSPDSLAPADIERYHGFLARGGGMLVMASGMEISPQMPLAMPKAPAWNAVLKPLGVAIQPDLAYDLLASEIVPIPSDFGQVLQQYPLFIRSRSTGASPINQEVQEVTLTWASTIDTAGSGGRVTPLLTTRRAGGRLTDRASIDPMQSWQETDLSPRLLAAAVTAANDSAGARGRAVVVGSTDFASDRFARRAPDNLSLALNAVDWLAQDEALIAIRSKDRRPPALVFSSEAVRETVKYANVIGVPALVALAGLIRLIRRRRKTRQTWQPSAVRLEQAA
jgi:ABC-type uncharacterized transport system involved in gliding motility auxiliary subunit